MQEIWKDIDGYEGLYQVSNLGNVKSMNYKNYGYSRNLVPKISNRGRPWVELAKGGKRKAFLINRLVAIAFLPNESNLPEVNHKDENVMNNNVDNLEWCTRLYNVRYSFDLHPERKSTADKAKCKTGRKNGKETWLPVRQYDLNGNFIKQWPNARTIFNSTKMSDWSIGECCRGKRKSAYGFKWQYAI